MIDTKEAVLEVLAELLALVHTTTGGPEALEAVRGYGAGDDEAEYLAALQDMLGTLIEVRQWEAELEGNDFAFIGVDEREPWGKSARVIKSTAPLPAVALEEALKALGHLSHGPAKRGRGGKVARW